MPYKVVRRPLRVFGTVYGVGDEIPDGVFVRPESWVRSGLIEEVKVAKVTARKRSGGSRKRAVRESVPVEEV
jgi:hypothetical protein